MDAQQDMREASEAADCASKKIPNCEQQVISYSDKVSECSNLIRKAERDIKETDNKIHEAKAKLQGVSVKRKVVADIQAKMMGAVCQLGTLCGVGNAAELQTRRLILLMTVMKVMGDMTSALGQITGDDLLHSEGITTLMLDMKEKLAV